MRIIGLILILFLASGGPVWGGELAQRLAIFPQWEGKPAVEIPKGELIYPDWMEGTWEVTSTLVEQIAPLSPAIVTLGFEQNLRYLNQPLRFNVKFKPDYPVTTIASFIPLVLPKTPLIIPDRAFNGFNIAQAYLSTEGVKSVKVNPKDPNEQITFLANGSQLISRVTGRKIETLDSDQFIATEITQQIFRSQSQIYLNEVETTTFYRLLDSGIIEGDQVSAIYLSSQDPDYFAAANRPVALYRYRLELIIAV
ncbi:DUF6816 family protein [Gloeocapsa sp. PCC 73106]|uniref:DUF6816 family protein n=1 Tax=Gloeocapsa sp. PCC 73106 TaxID=102232 RepID=UPI0002ABDA7E|nr:hypothetical protein [Gloeocapsa sp. PCC 73106]ELR96434.1 hypothetical protein GLO73106DRAFT_00002280 [Gloeocapsa sp. PCC 73106]